MKTLVVTNDFPPREGGIQTFVRAMVAQFDPREVAVYCSTSPGAAEYDAGCGFEVVRNRATMLLPTRSVTADVIATARRIGADRVWFGAAAPLALMTPSLRKAGIHRLVGSTHGHETGWAAAPGARQLLRRIARTLDVTTYITGYTGDKLRDALGPAAQLARVSPGVDVERFTPDVDGAAVRREHGLDGRTVIGCISRLVPRKGQDALIAALPRIRAVHPDAVLFLVGSGRDRARLQRLVQRAGLGEHVVMTGSAPTHELPAYYAATDIFAMPCRTRKRGLDVEGLGMVYLEAAATGKPVVAGNSGGAPEAVIDGETGYVVTDPRSPHAVAEPIIRLLADAGLAARMSERGREWVCEQWTWKRQSDRLKELLQVA
ncbi:phosphatidylinositol alpha-1,6-mannosyltransferase [Antricoccus suffuscus]|uniref:Phosphatidylinositol alpha-1,6-mannosyltransferase n=1 Tax=Antricoccus suffuscus TaxID=1629062 RepID=A0A2T0ZYP2_9ACTN|nr:glycosyltransferase family 4 protein [Antricoccus suffuscus]PRZ41367.1 phosphatidylinositol alpha-1,6-mannosyltransferase [Antricoccus suffuscus]